MPNHASMQHDLTVSISQHGCIHKKLPHAPEPKVEQLPVPRTLAMEPWRKLLPLNPIMTEKLVATGEHVEGDFAAPRSGVTGRHGGA